MNEKILIMDYSSFEREKTKYILNQIGNFEYIEFGDPSEYAAKADRLSNISIIIFDIAFPFDSDGFKILNDLRNKPHTKNVPIIIVTKSNNLDNRKASLQYAVSDYIIKPFTMTRLENSINSVVKLEKVFTYNVSTANNITMNFEEYIGKELKTCNRVKLPMSILFIKAIEEISSKASHKNYNNDEQKMIYTTTTEKFKLTLRSTDTVILNINNDVLVLLPFTDSANTKLVLKKSKEAIQKSLTDIHFTFDDFFYCVSVTFPDDGMDFLSLMEVVFKKITDKTLLEQISSIPMDSSALEYAKSRYNQSKKQY